MSKISENIKYLRKQKGLTQQQFADNMEIKRSLVGAYEEERADPKYDLLQKFSEYFELSIDELINDTINDKWKKKPNLSASNVRVLSITVDKNDNENIELVPVKASAGYLNGYADPEFVGALPKFSLPMFKSGTFRAFEIKGDSMLPLSSGSVIISEYVENWNDLKVGETAVVVSKNEGVVYKRMGSKLKQDKGLKLVSDNPIYDPYYVPAEDILEIWKAKAFISTDLPQPTPEPTMESLTTMMSQMQRSISELKKNEN
jgi:transcriptional regulator with XRE-family HTH domain